MPDTLSADEARRLALRAQGLIGTPDRRAGVPGVHRLLGAVQLDTISVLARSHELVPYSRLGPVGRRAVESAYWAEPATTFEYWSHAACILPIEEWPTYAVRRRRLRAKWHPRRQSTAKTRNTVLKALRERGPLTATDLGGAKKGGVWWDWSDVKIAAEDLFNWGEITVTRRVGWRRVYDLPERAIPAELYALDPSDEDCLHRLVTLSGRAQGVATEEELSRYFGIGREAVRATLPETDLVPVRVEGWKTAAYADPAALAAGPSRGRHRTTLLSPFDSLVWHRERMEQVFGMQHRLEAYTPKDKRVYGYFAMPVLSGGRLVARVDPARAGTTLVARTTTFERPDVTGVAAALREAASWVGADAVVVERVVPAELASPLRAAVR